MASQHITYRPTGRALGDNISLVNYLISLNTPVTLNIWYPKYGKKRFANTLHEVLPLFKNHQITIIDLPYVKKDQLEEKIPFEAGCIEENAPLIDELMWQGKDSKLMAYQFDGRSYSHEKNMNEEEQEQVLAAIRARGYQPIKLGQPVCLFRNAWIAARCKALISVHSGFAMLSKNNNMPVYIPKMRQPPERLLTMSNYKNCTITENAESLIELINKL